MTQPIVDGDAEAEPCSAHGRAALHSGARNRRLTQQRKVIGADGWHLAGLGSIPLSVADLLCDYLLFSFFLLKPLNSPCASVSQSSQ